MLNLDHVCAVQGQWTVQIASNLGCWFMQGSSQHTQDLREFVCSMAGDVSGGSAVATGLNWTYARQHSCHVEHLDAGQRQVGRISTCGRSCCELPQRPVHGVARGRLSGSTLQERPWACKHEAGHGEQQLYDPRECTCNGPQIGLQAPLSIPESSKLRWPRLLAGLTSDAPLHLPSQPHHRNVYRAR